MKAYYLQLIAIFLALLNFKASATDRFVDAASISPMPPYTNWATAAPDIQTAVDVADPGDLILVTNGIYQTGGQVDSFYASDMLNRVSIDKPLTVRSVNGPAVTIILGNPVSGPDAVRCVNMVDNAVLSGFTLKNGGTMGDYFWASVYGDFHQQCGGGVSAGAAAIVTNCIIIGCSAYMNGGGANGGILKNCTLTNNTANLGGGAMNSTLENCRLLDNSAAGNGGGAEGGTLVNCAIAGNVSHANGGGLADGAATNCTFTANTARGSGGGTSGSTLNNCIIYHNTAQARPEYDGGALNYCSTLPLPPAGTGNITGEPELADLVHLSAGSPCRAAGSAVYAKGLDIDGEAWSNPPSIGCAEFYSGSATGALAVSLSAAYTNCATGFTVDFHGQITGHAASNVWDFGDGTSVTNQLNPAHSWPAGGDYLVTLTAFNDSNPGGVGASTLVHVLQNPVCYVSLISTNPVVPFNSWETAAADIQSAVDVAVVGGTVLVTNGVYNSGGRIAFGSLSNRVSIIKPITVRSVNGPAVTAIAGFPTNDATAIRCVYLTNDATLVGFTLTNGAARNDGGDWILDMSGAGVWCESFRASVSNCVFAGNVAFGNAGGGAYQGTLSDCTFLHNTSGWSGGGADSAVLKHCVLSNNISYNGGGASSSTLVNCVLTRNFTLIDSDHTANGGGASGCTLTGCVLRDNQSLTGGGASGSTLINCTVIFNDTTGGGGAVNSSTLTNCIVYYNHAPNGTNYSDDSSLFYCDTTPLPTNGANNVTGDPLFADLTHISSSSPCRGAGSAAVTGGVDIDSDVWLNPPSIGADEFNAASATGALTVAISQSFTNVAIGIVVDFVGHISGHAIANRWDFGDGTIVSNQLSPSHSWSAPGNYPVTLTVFNGDNPGGVSASETIYVLQNPIHYVALDNPNPAPPYFSWATAATNIQDALDVAFAGGTIMVSNGVYQTGGAMVLAGSTNRVAVVKPLALQSVNGAGATVIDGGNTVRCLYLTNHVSVTGFTLRNGVGVNGGGVYCENDDVLNDCALTGNSSPAEWSSGGGAYRGTLNHCTLTGNSASYLGGGAVYAGLNSCVLSNNGPVAYGGAAYACGMNHCLVVSNSAAWGGGVEGGQVDNSLLIGNAATYGGGGAIWSTLNNCTVVANFAPLATPGYYSGAGVYDGAANNCIIYYNNGDNWTADFLGISLNHCCTTPAPGGIVNITNAPLFVDLASRDFHLRTNSPCINSGNNAFVSDTNDFDGSVRITGGTVDIGAYEFQSPASVLSYAWAQQFGLPTDGSVDFSDTDGDGLNNWQEWIAGTVPTSTASALKMLSTSNSTAGVTVTWQSVGGMNYFVQRSVTLGSQPAFSIIQTNIPGLPGTTGYTDTNAIDNGPFFYRVGVER